MVKNKKKIKLTPDDINWMQEWKDGSIKKRTVPLLKVSNTSLSNKLMSGGTQTYFLIV